MLLPTKAAAAYAQINPMLCTASARDYNRVMLLKLCAFRIIKVHAIVMVSQRPYFRFPDDHTAPTTTTTARDGGCVVRGSCLLFTAVLWGSRTQNIASLWPSKWTSTREILHYRWRLFTCCASQSASHVVLNWLGGSKVEQVKPPWGNCR